MQNFRLTCTSKEHFVEGSEYLSWVFSKHGVSGQGSQRPEKR